MVIHIPQLPNQPYLPPPHEGALEHQIAVLRDVLFYMYYSYEMNQILNSRVCERIFFWVPPFLTHILISAVLCALFFYAQILHTQIPVPRILHSYCCHFPFQRSNFQHMHEFVVKYSLSPYAYRSSKLLVCAYVAKYIFSSVQMALLLLLLFGTNG